jgi:hypothetical protein
MQHSLNQARHVVRFKSFPDQKAQQMQQLSLSLFLSKSTFPTFISLKKPLPITCFFTFKTPKNRTHINLQVS